MRGQTPRLLPPAELLRWTRGVCLRHRGAHAMHLQGEQPLMSTAAPHPDSFKCRKTLTAGGKTYEYFSLPEAEKNGLTGISTLPTSLKVLLENLLRFEDGRSVRADDIRAVADWLTARTSTREIAYRPAR